MDATFLQSSRSRACLWLTAALLALTACTRDNVEGLANGYPSEVGAIIVNKCATTGCHTDQSAEAAAGLNLSRWDALFEGSRGGSAVIPYSPEMSFLLYSVNIDSSKGPTLIPTMPLNAPALSPAEYETLRDWIARGARNARGEERFPPSTSRRKWYVGNHGCDLVAVFDAESRQIMRYVEVGTEPYEEQIYGMAVSPDRRHWYAVMSSYGDKLQQFSTLTDELEAMIPLGHYSSTDLVITPDSKMAFVISQYLQQIDVIDLVAGARIGSPVGTAQVISGPALHPLRQELYLAQSQRQALYRIPYDHAGSLAAPQTIDLVQGRPPMVAGNLWPSDIAFLPDGSKYFVACQHSGEVRVLSGQNDSLLDVVTMGAETHQLAVSMSRHLLFASCMDDTSTLGQVTGQRGSVAAIDTRTHQVLGRIYTGFQPYAMVLDETAGTLLVMNRNMLNDGPVSHHANPCGGRNGYATLVNLNTLTLEPVFRQELSINPLVGAIKP